MGRAPGQRVGVRSHEDLVAWQLAAELRDLVFDLVSDGAAARDRYFTSDIRRAASSGAANVAEGFSRFRPREFHRFLEVARASIAETENHLQAGLHAGYFTREQYTEARRSARRAGTAVSALMRYLRTKAASDRATEIRQRTDPDWR